MTHHPATHPLVVQFAHATDPAERAALVLATPLALLREFRMLYRAALAERPAPAIAAYLDWLSAHDFAVRDAFGRVPAWLDEQLTVARHDLYILAGSIRLDDPDRRATAGEPRGHGPPGG